MDWGQTIAIIVSVLAVGVSLAVHNTNQFNRLVNRIQDIDNRLQGVEREQARTLGFLEGRGITGKAPAEAERAT